MRKRCPHGGYSGTCRHCRAERARRNYWRRWAKFPHLLRRGPKVSPSDEQAPALIAIVEFGRPLTLLEQK